MTMIFWVLVLMFLVVASVHENISEDRDSALLCLFGEVIIAITLFFVVRGMW